MKNYIKLAKQGRSDFDLRITTNPSNDFLSCASVNDEEMIFNGTLDIVTRLIFGIPILALTAWWIKGLPEVLEYFGEHFIMDLLPTWLPDF